MRLLCQDIFNADMVLPVVCKIIFVKKSFIDTEMKILQPDGIGIITFNIELFNEASSKSFIKHVITTKQ